MHACHALHSLLVVLLGKGPICVITHVHACSAWSAGGRVTCEPSWSALALLTWQVVESAELNCRHQEAVLYTALPVCSTCLLTILACISGCQMPHDEC
jgi:hypothetical protein